jgi:hypothetical protein
MRSRRAGWPTSIVLKAWGAAVMLLVASVPFFNYADQPRRLIGAAATLSAFLMIRLVWRAQARRYDEISRKLEAVAIAIGKPGASVSADDGQFGEHGPAARNAALQTVALFDRLQRDRKHRGA